MKQVNSETAEVSWMSLWPEINWAECFESAWIVSDGNDEAAVNIQVWQNSFGFNPVRVHDSLSYKHWVLQLQIKFESFITDTCKR